MSEITFLDQVVIGREFAKVGVAQKNFDKDTSRVDAGEGSYVALVLALCMGAVALEIARRIAKNPEGPNEVSQKG